jgi:hypothetical protein
MRNPDWTDQENLLIFTYILKYPNRPDIELAQELREANFKNGDLFINSKRSVSAIHQHIKELKKRQNQLYVPDPKKDPLASNI